MDTATFSIGRLDDAGYQLKMVYEGISDECLNMKVTDVASTPKEILIHLGDAYNAFLTSLGGAAYEWGSYHPVATDWEPMWTEVWDLRQLAVGKVKENPEATAELAGSYIVGHDYYHVGQLCLARLAYDDSWDPYCIYQ